jgi:hypothetical protein
MNERTSNTAGIFPQQSDSLTAMLQKAFGFSSFRPNRKLSVDDGLLLSCG